MGEYSMRSYFQQMPTVGKPLVAPNAENHPAAAAKARGRARCHLLWLNLALLAVFSLWLGKYEAEWLIEGNAWLIERVVF